jgi:diaminopimelate decarboxylase
MLLNPVSFLEKYGSPLYVYEEELLKETIDHITQAIPYPNTSFRFATVTNGNISLLKIFRGKGWGIHANTPGDIYLALQAGFKAEDIVYSGSNLNREQMSQVLNWEVGTLNLDSIWQVKLLGEVYQQLGPTIKTPRLGLRLNFPSITGPSRIGVQPEEFHQAREIAQDQGLQIQGLHFYRGTGTNATNAFTQVISQLLAIAQTLPDWQYLDFGGGFGYPYREGVAFDWSYFGQALTETLDGLNIELIIEPGRAAIAGCAILLTTVVSVKWQGKKQIVGVDTTVGNLSVPSVHGGYRKIIAFDKDTSCYPTDICGNTTYSRDYLGKNCALPILNPGDILAILDVGAYGYAMSSHFLHCPRPAEVLVTQTGDRLIREREAYSVLLNNQIL